MRASMWLVYAAVSLSLSGSTFVLAQDQSAPAPAAPAAAQPVVPGKPAKKKKEKPPKVTPVSISHGILTVDGWTAKAGLNYDIADFKYIYISTPGVGTAVISNQPFPGAKEQPAAFNESGLKITVDGHVLEVASDKRLLGKKPESAWVLVDNTYTFPSTYATIGYGYDTRSPYMWPGSKPNGAVKGVATNAPTLPAYMRNGAVTAAICAPVKAGMSEVQLKTVNPNNLPPCKSGPMLPADKNAPIVAASPAPQAPATTEPPPPVVSAGAPSTPEQTNPTPAGPAK